MTREEKLSRLKEEYLRVVEKGGPSKEKARLESEIWAVAGVIKGNGDDLTKVYREWFRDNFGEGASRYEIFRHLYRSKWAHPLFDEIDKGRLSVRRCRDVFSRVNFLVRRHEIKHAQALKSIMDQYDGTIKSITNATLAGAVSIDISDGRDPMNRLAKVFRKSVQHSAEVYVTNALKKMGVKSEDQEELVGGFIIDVDEAVSELMASVHRQRRNAKEEGRVKIGYRRFTWACEVLGLQATFGEEVDLKLVGRAVRRRARDLHPDRNKNPHAKEEYDNVNRAKEILVEYSFFSRKGTGNGNTKKESTQSSRV